MSEIASAGQIRMSFVRWALVSVPATLFLGLLMGRLSNSGFNNPWYDALIKPDIQPPGWAFGVAWTILYVMLGLALAIVLNARGNRYRPYAITLFAIAFAANLAWSPLFFAAHQVFAAFFLILFMLAFGIATTIAFGRVRQAAAWLMLPYLLWLSFASILNWQTHVLNPDAETLAPVHPVTQIDV